jgi:orotate phosphoribosyltransferase/AMMECR1 domain-containing protein
MSVDAARQELLGLLLRDGIFRSTQAQTIRGPDGKPARWMLDSLRVSLTPRGAELAARCLVPLLERFESRQIATYGTTGIPLLAACIAASQGRLRGILVRKELKPHGSRKLIEGPCDPDEPVVVLDDSVSSGHSMWRCIEKLHEAGFRVEGGVCLARFGFEGGWARLRERGLHMETVYDVYDDFVPLVDGPEHAPPRNASRVAPPVERADEPFEDGLHPAHLARRVMERFLAGEPIPRAPERFDREHDAAGGVFVSVRSLEKLSLRHARDGFWSLPGEERLPAGEAVVRAALRTARALTRDQLAASAIAVTFLGALEEVTIGQLDNDRYGILVASRERAGRFGGALPRMPGMSREWAQLEHARRRNAQLLPVEPYLLYRHTVDKAVEPGRSWQPTGVPLQPAADGDRHARVAARALDLVRAQLGGTRPRTGPEAPPPAEMIFVSIHQKGRVTGCMGARARTDEDLARVVQLALGDHRFEARSDAALLDATAVSVSFLDRPTGLVPMAPKEITAYVRHGEQALMVQQGTRQALLLPTAAVQHSLGPEQFVAEVIDKAGITRPPYFWAVFDCVTWLADGDGARRLVDGLPEAPPAPSLDAARAAHVPRLLGYLLRHQRADGLRNGHYRPFLDKLGPELDLARQIHGAWVLARAHRVLGGDLALGAAARRSVEAILAQTAHDEAGEAWVGGRKSLVEVAFLLLALCELDLPQADELARQLAASLWKRVGRHGVIASPELPPGTQDAELLQDYLPAQALLALAAAVARGKTAVDAPALARAISTYRHRFRYRRNWGQVAWLGQAAAAWWHVGRDPAHAALAFEIADWAITHQLEKSGGFINEMQADSPGCSTGVYLEGVAAALGVAVALPDEERAARYRRSCARGLDFLDRLIYQERDRALLPNPELATGGVRVSLTGGDVRIDFTQHALNALLLLDGAVGR